MKKEYQDKMHHYMFTITFHYLLEDVLKQKTINCVILIPVLGITHKVLDNTKLAAMQQMFNEYGIEAEALKEMIINNISYLGNMTEEVFNPKKCESDAVH